MKSETGPTMPVALTIASSDSGGGAGIQADLKTFHAFGVFGTSAVAAITAQNTLGVRGVHTIPLELVAAQVEAVVTDLRPAACKSGMLATRALVTTVATTLRTHELEQYVLDPVMVATSGDRLLDADATDAVLRELVPLALLVTPNLDEASTLAGFTVDDAATMRRAAHMLVDAGAGAALIKGGHLRGSDLIDVLYDGRELRTYRHTRLETRNTHGTGCTLSAAVAAGLARGEDLVGAVEHALDYLQRAMASAPNLGQGNGPLNHFVPVPQSLLADR